MSSNTLHTMMDYPLTLTALLERAGRYATNVEIVSRLPDRSLHRYTWGQLHQRALRLAESLHSIGLKKGDRVATLMWNHYAHLECYFGIPAAGGVLHPLNLRLHPDEIAWIANHAQDRFLIVDDVLLPVLEKFADKVKFEYIIVVRHSLVAGTSQSAQHGYVDYEDWLQSASGNFKLPALSENDGASMCYTSGTTGSPKGVLYSHRSQVLHSMSQAMA
ncbi:MAG TPA: AMP-binding protein, partial [Candidatus Angelobacter sp.]|nr:AMP-binding protein [Candidatus Angelobacter sp.]